MRSLYYLLIGALMLCSCSRKELLEPNGKPLSDIAKYPETNISLQVHGYIPSIFTRDATGIPQQNFSPSALGRKNPFQTMAGLPEITKDSLWQDGFGRTLYAETTEMAMFQNTAMDRLIFAGALLQGNSLADLDLKPIAEYQGKVKPITVSVSLTAKRVSGTINNPSLSATRTFVSDILSQNNIGTQTAGYSFNMERFTAYDELKLAFGSNVKTGALFFKKENTTTETRTKIAKRSGIYVKFVQKNFTLDLDLPDKGNLMQDTVNLQGLSKYFPVYVSSITYGRMGILAIESDSSYEATYEAYNTAFKALFVSGTNTLTTEQKRIIDQADMRIYLVGTDGDGSVQTVRGLDAFLALATKGRTFSPSAPGIPIYCSLSYLGDNSIVKTRFKVDISLDPIYARIEYEDVKRKTEQTSSGQPGSPSFSSGSETYTSASVYMKFYSDPMATKPTFPPANLGFYYKQYKSFYSYNRDDVAGESTSEDKKDQGTFLKQNAFLDSKILLTNGMIGYESNSSGLEDWGAGGSVRFERSYSEGTSFELLPGGLYKVLSPKGR
ncbi:MAG TPA: thiol-activated cytolysin family protein [Chitinophaga sp.]|uniref:thiol-activated cytolysin family protein n=1 Tax=Chitinophaga sp. TaxID=1869181 RepID=UPI002CEED6DB|nr:thiol-activated cytolysin family protein [Chitinophaga sp.]HVI48589.1 thiol-activated cytolysin family protein [Chitinophaga sp.]